MGVPGGAAKMRELMDSFAGGTQAGGTQAGQAGLGGLIAAMQGAASAGGKTFDDMFDSLAKGTPVGQMAEENAKLMIRSMIQAAKADGEIDPTERAKILEQLGDVDPAERIASPQPQPEPVIERAPEKPRPRRLTASDRIKIIGLLSNAKIALSENRLMSPAGDNAFERYQRVLALDPGNETARQGLRNVADRYLSLADAAVGQGETEQARVYLGRAREADARHPGLEAAEARLRAR